MTSKHWLLTPSQPRSFYYEVVDLERHVIRTPMNEEKEGIKIQRTVDHSGCVSDASLTILNNDNNNDNDNDDNNNKKIKNKIK